MDIISFAKASGAEAGAEKYTREYVVANPAEAPTAGPLYTIKIGDQIYDNNSYPCLSGDTLISMADGTKKQIKDVVKGEKILSYNPVSGEKCTAIVIEAYITGQTTRFDNHIFSDGKHLCTFDHHGYYDATAKRIKNIQNVNPYATGAKRSFFLNEDLEQVLITCNIMASRYGTVCNRYNLISSNNLYFANGILCGHSPVDKMAFFTHRQIQDMLPDNIAGLFLQDCDVYNSFNSIYENPEYLTETAEARNAFHLANRIIIRDRKALAALDYKVMKYTEGALSAEEYQTVIDKKAELRERINQYRPIYHENLELIQAANLKYRGGATDQSIFENCCTRDNNAFNLIDSWING